ncbi:single-stranded-DNA-specific exonuclease [Sphingomonas guangdongensis]|uniref:Single-stranded-DNA-specific exonuclease n=1 Tax=Sphingomonas guangdongensis TaxID=1141890 RepID=A0A285R5N5_9SPHN|nr:DHH family phosphoesterase [Sphingomonas guangdongensis]SOB87662.1 single-stranded-DNA-specific exonuclease [Sphingomonas guangdongensis]
MLGRLAHVDDPRAAARAAFEDGLAAFDRTRPVVVLCHFDADGLSAAAILVRALTAASWRATPVLVGKGETPWDPAVTARLREHDPGGLIVADLGTRADPVLPGCPTVIIDHHVPTGAPDDAITLSGNGLEPEPTTALIAWWAVQALAPDESLLWLAAIGLIGDMADDRGFPELADAQQRFGKTALKDAVVLLNAPRRTAAADAAPALRLLLESDGPKAITKGESADAQALHAARAEVRAEMDVAKRAAPIVAGDVALVPLDSACQIHPLIAQQWRGRLKDKIVIAANRGYRAGWVHFATRSASGRDLIAFLADHRPPGADDRFGNGHAQATGGALRLSDWNHFAASIGVPQAQVPA